MGEDEKPAEGGGEVARLGSVYCYQRKREGLPTVLGERKTSIFEYTVTGSLRRAQDGGASCLRAGMKL